MTNEAKLSRGGQLAKGALEDTTNEHFQGLDLVVVRCESESPSLLLHRLRLSLQIECQYAAAKWILCVCLHVTLAYSIAVTTKSWRASHRQLVPFRLPLHYLDRCSSKDAPFITTDNFLPSEGSIKGHTWTLTRLRVFLRKVQQNSVRLVAACLVSRWISCRTKSVPTRFQHPTGSECIYGFKWTEPR